MDKGIILGPPGESKPDPVGDAERAARAIQSAPMTASGIVIPPHVLEAQEAAAAPGPNRAQRRAMERAARRAGRRR